MTEHMKCVICKHGEPAAGLATVTLVHDETTLVVKGVPAQVCSNCGEEHVDESVTAHILKIAEASSAAGVEVDVRRYVHNQDVDPAALATSIGYDPSKPQMTLGDLLDSEVVGMWEHRTDIGDSVEFARSLRRRNASDV